MTDVQASRLSVRELAELARAGVAVARHRTTEVAFEVHHLADRPGYFFGQQGWPLGKRRSGPDGSGGGDEPFFETLSSAAYGAGLVVRTAVRPVKRARDTAEAAPPQAPEKQDDTTWIFRRSAQPNPSFLYESTAGLEGLIAISDRPEALSLVHGQAIREIVQQIAQTASTQDAPIISLQSPVQVPARPSGSSTADLQDDWTWSSSLGVRFSVAFRDTSVEQRWTTVGSLADFCVARGLGMWVTDWRPGRRGGNWYPIVRRRKDRLHDHLERLENQMRTKGHQAVSLACPITIVGPARVGSTNAVMRFLQRFTPSSTIAVSIASLDDLAFIHLLLALPHNKSMDSARNALCRAAGSARGHSFYEDLKGVLEALGCEMSAKLADEVMQGLMERAIDYQVFAGPPVVTRSGWDHGGRPLWFAWEVDRSEHGMALPLRELAEALRAMDLLKLPAHRLRSRKTAGLEGANIEYLVCREVADGRMRGKGKLSIPDVLWHKLYRDREPARAAKKIAVRLEELWHHELASQTSTDGGHPSPGQSCDLSVGWREQWLGHWASALY